MDMVKSLMRMAEYLKDISSMIKDMAKDNILTQMELKLKGIMITGHFLKAKLFGMMELIMLVILRTVNHMVKDCNIILMGQFLSKENGKMANLKIIHVHPAKKVIPQQQEIELQNQPEAKLMNLIKKIIL